MDLNSIRSVCFDLRREYHRRPATWSCNDLGHRKRLRICMEGLYDSWAFFRFSVAYCERGSLPWFT